MSENGELHDVQLVADDVHVKQLELHVPQAGLELRVVMNLLVSLQLERHRFSEVDTYSLVKHYWAHV
jgi:hypothetical protein